MNPVSPTARLSLVAGIASLAFAIGGALVTQFMDPGTTVRVLGVLIWIVGALAIAGLALGLISGFKGPARSGALVSVVTLVLLGLFLSYSGYGTTSSGSPAPVAAGG